MVKTVNFAGESRTMGISDYGKITRRMLLDVALRCNVEKENRRAFIEKTQEYMANWAFPPYAIDACDNVKKCISFLIAAKSLGMGLGEFLQQYANALYVDYDNETFADGLEKFMEMVGDVYEESREILYRKMMYSVE